MKERYVAFLRAVNTGKRRVTNEELCRHTADLGFTSVAAFLASGNLIFDAESGDPEHVATRLAHGLEKALAFDVPVFLRTGAAVVRVAQLNPFDPPELSGTLGKVQVAFLESHPPSEVATEVLAMGSADDKLKLRGTEMFWLPKAGVSTSDLHIKRLEKLLRPFTIRTHHSVGRLASKLLAP